MRFSFLVFFFVLHIATAQEHQGGMDSMDSSSMKMDPAADLLMKQASGTSMNPLAGGMPMIMQQADNWHVMWMGQAFLVDTQQSGDRGHDKFYSPNWLMGMAQHSFAGGTFEFVSMFSLDPATVTQRRYPELFQTGETAFGKPIVDGQHPHDFFMDLGFHWAKALNENTVFQIYYAPVGDPALGPVAFPHRSSAAELPEAPLGHHWQDSTHIANNVLTAAVKWGILRLEVSGFYGTEPDENRWNIDWGPIDSWSARLSLFATKNWMAQVSLGRLNQPERQQPGAVVRSTASLHYTRPVHDSAWATSAIWGRNHETLHARNTNSYLLESVFPLSKQNLITGRAELVDKDELFADSEPLEQKLAISAGSTFRIGAFTAGYTRVLSSWFRVESAVGANATAYTLPEVIKPYYGDHPWGANFFARFRLK